MARKTRRSSPRGPEFHPEKQCCSMDPNTCSNVDWLLPRTEVYSLTLTRNWPSNLGKILTSDASQFSKRSQGLICSISHRWIHTTGHSVTPKSHYKLTSNPSLTYLTTDWPLIPAIEEVLTLASCLINEVIRGKLWERLGIPLSPNQTMGQHPL